jgi:hypothetical protein
MAHEIKQEWQLNKVTVIPLVLSATGVIPNMFPESRCPQFTGTPTVPGPVSGDTIHWEKIPQ